MFRIVLRIWLWRPSYGVGSARRHAQGDSKLKSARMEGEIARRHAQGDSCTSAMARLLSVRSPARAGGQWPPSRLPPMPDTLAGTRRGTVDAQFGVAACRWPSPKGLVCLETGESGQGWPISGQRVGATVLHLLLATRRAPSVRSFSTSLLNSWIEHLTRAKDACATKTHRPCSS